MLETSFKICWLESLNLSGEKATRAPIFRHFFSSVATKYNCSQSFQYRCSFQHLIIAIECNFDDLHHLTSFSSQICFSDIFQGSNVSFHFLLTKFFFKKRTLYEQIEINPKGKCKPNSDYFYIISHFT